MRSLFPSLLLVFVLPIYVLGGSHSTSNGPFHRRQSRRASRLQARSFRATFYDVGLGACGKTNVPSDFVVALNAQQYGNGEDCFKMITIDYKGKSTQAQIVDECPGCPYGGLDMSSGLFQFFEPDLGVGVLQVDWHFSDQGAPPPPPTQDTPSTEPPLPKSTHQTSSKTHTEEPTPSSSTEQPAETNTPSQYNSTLTSGTLSSPSTNVLNPYISATPLPIPMALNNIANIGTLMVDLGQLVLSA